ncbi:helix-turn-helix domain-containing protein [Lawsonibacter sp. OA9]|uniref:excisionase n=1 Tax=Lawsonibacter sp. OA9 TaxID=2914163 RepID=UPI001F067DE1|nr:excisionase [Lawsonibacter sp. OA9]MCH1978751.1 helix-turn-helix domain-containing protein [Lawsonibacter sp. OA9]
MTAQVPIKDKFCLTIEEAADYFNIGEKKLRKIVVENLSSDFVIQNGVKYLIKRKRFEAFLDETSAI